jgi:hypothetical protein
MSIAIESTAPVDVDRIAAIDAELSLDFAVSSGLLMDCTVDAESPIDLSPSPLPPNHP